MRIAHGPSVALVVALCGCGDDTVGSIATGSTGTDTGASSSSTATAPAQTSSGADPDTSSSTTAASPAPLEYARGIRLTGLVANQGMQIDLIADGVDIDPAEYPVRLITGRRTLVRAFWSVHADFTPRELVSRLVVDYPDGTEFVDDRPMMVEGESENDGPSFQWLLAPDRVVAGMRVRAFALEPDVALATGEISDPPPVLPYAGPVELPLLDAPLELEVVLVPVLHQFDGCERAPVPTDLDVEQMAQALEQANAVQQAILTLGDPMPYTDPIGTQDMGFSPILGALAMRREQDAPADNVYYYGLIDPCDGFPPGLLGQALGIPSAPLRELANQRVSTGRWLGDGATTSETFVHEVGHSQGRRHVTCSGGEGGPENDYPHDSGRIGNWGFGIHDFELRQPTSARDYMTYCANEFVSDYGWEQTLDVIEILTGWNDADIAPGGGEILMGIVYEGGRAQWWPARGALVEPETADARVVWTIDGLEHITAARLGSLPDGPGTLVTAAVPEAFASASMARLEPGGAAPVSVDLRQLRR